MGPVAEYDSRLFENHRGKADDRRRNKGAFEMTLRKFRVSCLQCGLDHLEASGDMADKEAIKHRRLNPEHSVSVNEE